MKNEKKFNKKKLKNFQKYKATPYGYYSYLAEKKLNLLYNLKFLKFFIDKSGKIKSSLQTGLQRRLQKKISMLTKKNRAIGFIPFKGVVSRAEKDFKK